jgi:DNA-binding transcriptional regulator YiaG
LRKASLATALKHEVRRHSGREVKATKLRLRKLQKQVTALRAEARKDRQAVARLRAKLGRLGTRAAGRVAKAKGEGPGRRTSPHTIRALRERMSLSRLQFAKLLGVSAGSIFGWESGRTTPRRDSLARFRALKKAGLRAARAEAKTVGKPSGRRRSKARSARRRKG